MPFIRPRGSAKVPGSGRKRGTKNRRSIAARALCSELLVDVNYQYRLRRDFARRHIHPSVEALMWAYSIGKPTEVLEVSGRFTMNERLEAERQLIRSTLDPAELELLAAESQKLLDDALARARAKHVTGTIIDTVATPSAAPATTVEAKLPETTSESGTDPRAKRRHSE